MSRSCCRGIVSLLVGLQRLNAIKAERHKGATESQRVWGESHTAYNKAGVFALPCLRAKWIPVAQKREIPSFSLRLSLEVVAY